MWEVGIICGTSSNDVGHRRDVEKYRDLRIEGSLFLLKFSGRCSGTLIGSAGGYVEQVSCVLRVMEGRLFLLCIGLGRWFRWFLDACRLIDSDNKNC